MVRVYYRHAAVHSAGFHEEHTRDTRRFLWKKSEVTLGKALHNAIQ